MDITLNAFLANSLQTDDGAHAKFFRALFESCHQLDTVEIRLAPADILRDQGILNGDDTILRVALTGNGRLLADGADRPRSDFIRFYCGDAIRLAVNDAMRFA